MIMKFKSPYRVCLTGGLLDIFPIYKMVDAITVNAAINKYVTVEVDDEKPFNIISESGDNELARYMARCYKVDKGEFKITHDLPACSGMGGSAALGVCLAYAFGEGNRHNACTVSYLVENLMLGIVGGNQDQIVTAYGGFNIVRQWNFDKFIPDGFFQKRVLSELEFRMRDGKTSGEENKKIVTDYVNGKKSIVNVINKIRELSAMAGIALQKGDARTFVKAVKRENGLRFRLTPRDGGLLGGLEFEPRGVRRSYYYE